MKTRSFFFFFLLSLVMTYPLIFHFTTAINDRGDSLFNAWTLAWNHHQLLTDPLHYFDANIFFPHLKTFAYSDHQLASALLSFPVFLLGAGPITVYNFVLLASFVLCGWGMFLLLKELTQNIPASFLAGIGFAFCAYRFSQLPHLQVLTYQWMPFALLYLHRAFEKAPSWKNFLLFGLFFLLQLLSCNYLAIMFSITVVVWGLFMLSSLWRQSQWQGFVKLAVVASLVSLVFLPFALPYIELKKENGFSRSFDDVKQYSARAENYLGVTGKHRFYPQTLKRFADQERDLFQGFTLMGLGLAALFLSRWRKYKWLYGVLLLLAFLLSMGPKAKLFGFSLGGQPYKALYYLMPGFDGMRVASRFAVIVSLALSVLAGLCVASILEKIKRKTAAFLLSLLLGGAILADGWCVPLRYTIFDAEPPPHNVWLKTADEIHSVINFPMHHGAGSYRTMNYMYWSIWNWKKMVNGYSGFFPPGYDDFEIRMRSFPSKETIAELRQLGVDHAIVYTHQYPLDMWEQMRQRLQASRELELVKQFDSVQIYRIQSHK